jgi:hypothetical protein
MNKFSISVACFLLTPLAFAISSQNNEAPPAELPFKDFQYNQTEKSRYPEFSIVGSWTYKALNSTCKDTYTFQNDGTMRGTSSNQVVDSTYTISEQHTQYAFYVLKHKIITTNHQKDCEGELAEVGHEGLHYIRYDLTGDNMIMCEDETALLYNCFGPLTRSK